MNTKSKQVNIAGVRVDVVTHAEVFDMVREMFDSGVCNQIATVNAEFVMEAQKNVAFKDMLNACALNTADGSGILWAARYLAAPRRTPVKSITTTGHSTNNDTKGHEVLWRLQEVWRMVYMGASLVLWPAYCKTVLPERISGVDLMVELCRLAEKEQKKVMLVGGLPGVGKQAMLKLQHQFPQLVIDAVGDQLQFFKEGDEWKCDEMINNDILERIQAFQPDMMFVAYGHPKQEYWINQHKDVLSSVRVAMGVGGSFDFIAGTIGRAPKIFRTLGIEWLWRLFRQPQRLPRIVTATVKFIGTVMLFKMRNM